MMKPEMILYSDLPDILFEDRYKDYGTYQLRKQYHRRLLIALGSIPVMPGLFFRINFLNKTLRSETIAGLPLAKEVVVQQIEIEKPMPIPPEAPRQRSVARNNSSGFRTFGNPDIFGFVYFLSCPNPK